MSRLKKSCFELYRNEINQGHCTLKLLSIFVFLIDQCASLVRLICSQCDPWLAKCLGGTTWVCYTGWLITSKLFSFFSQKYCCYLNKKGHVLGKFKSLTTKHNSIYQCQWNTRWAFPQKHDIFRCENDMLFSHVKRSLLLWLHNTLHPSQQKKKIK